MAVNRKKMLESIDNVEDFIMKKQLKLHNIFLQKMDYKISYTDIEITPWSGILLLKKMLDKMDFDSCLSGLDLPESSSNRGYRSNQLIKQFMTSVWCGANKFEHTEVTRQGYSSILGI
jgi:hypothetical protein